MMQEQLEALQASRSGPVPTKVCVVCVCVRARARVRARACLCSDVSCVRFRCSACVCVGGGGGRARWCAVSNEISTGCCSDPKNIYYHPQRAEHGVWHYGAAAARDSTVGDAAGVHRVFRPLSFLIGTLNLACAMCEVLRMCAQSCDVA